MRRLDDLGDRGAQIAQDLGRLRFRPFRGRAARNGDRRRRRRPAVKTMAAAFHGRNRAYGEALAARDAEALAAALARNVYGARRGLLRRRARAAASPPPPPRSTLAREEIDFFSRRPVFLSRSVGRRAMTTEVLFSRPVGSTPCPKRGSPRRSRPTRPSARLSPSSTACRDRQPDGDVRAEARRPRRRARRRRGPCGIDANLRRLARAVRGDARRTGRRALRALRRRGRGAPRRFGRREPRRSTSTARTRPIRSSTAGSILARWRPNSLRWASILIRASRASPSRRRPRTVRRFALRRARRAEARNAEARSRRPLGRSIARRRAVEPRPRLLRAAPPDGTGSPRRPSARRTACRSAGPPRSSAAATTLPAGR